MAPSPDGAKMIRLVSSDGQAFDVSKETIAAASGMIKSMINTGHAADVVPLPKVSAATLSRVLDYVKEHFADDTDADCSPFLPHAYQPHTHFDAGFVNVDDDTLFDLIIAADNLQITKLLDLTCRAIADEIRGKTIEQIRSRFGINNDYTEEEEEEVRRENSWAFD